MTTTKSRSTTATAKEWRHALARMTILALAASGAWALLALLALLVAQLVAWGMEP